MADTVALPGLFPLLRSRPRYRDLLDRVSSGSASRLPLLDSAKPFVLAGLHRDVEQPLLVLTPEAPRARQLADQICVYLGDSARVAFFPETDALFYEQLGWDPALAQERLSGLRLLQGGGVLVASVRAALQRLWPPQAFGAAEREVARGQRIDLERTLAEWIGLGYEPAASVTQPGELARRGGIVDVFPPSSPLPVRLELFDDE
ncbi:MAG: hypothetical protein HY329_20120, partial [Chloroflexi bacterium]|nr:hypothetical protein [Chloroflexota bacterium]